MNTMTTEKPGQILPLGSLPPTSVMGQQPLSISGQLWGNLFGLCQDVTERVCLYCGERGTKACQNDTLLAAKALQYKDYRTVDLVGHELRLEDWKMKNSAPSPGLLLGPNRIVRGQNPGLKTDAELWGLPPLEEVL